MKAWSQQKKDWCCTHEMAGCIEPSPEPFDCDEDLHLRLNKWSPEKMKWCCHHHGKGCMDGPFTTTVTDKFWCDGAYPEFWPPAKKSWCCHYRGKGCSTTTTGNIDCEYSPEGEDSIDKGWSDFKKRYCCTTFGVACQTDEFDCQAGDASWQLGWSPKKKQWCCENKDLHCYACNMAIYHRWSQEESGWCCHHEDKCGPPTTIKPSTYFFR